MNRKLIGTIGLVSALAAAVIGEAKARTFDVDYSGVEGKVYLLIPSSAISRYKKFEVPFMTKLFKEYAPKVELEVLNANDQAAQQVSQMDAALANGASGVILISVDPSQSGGMLARAAADNVPVVTFAQDVGKGPAAYHVTVPFEDIGSAQAENVVKNLPTARPVKLAMMLGDPKFAFYVEQMKGFNKVIGPLVEDGTIKIVCQADALLWSPDAAQKNMEQCLSQTSNEVDGVFVMNDDTGSGVMAALLAQGLQGQVPIFGSYDATVDGIKRVLVGWQAADMSPPYYAMDEKAVVLMLSAIAGTKPPEGVVNGSWDNGFVEGGVPTSYTPNVFISKDNIQQTVIDAGLWTKAELCTTYAAEAEFCKAQ